MLVETHSLTKRYGSLTALCDCSLTVDRGEIYGLLGPNGSGKSTLLRLLMGFLRPTSGKARIDKFDCYRQSIDVHRRTAYLPGEARMFRRMKGRDALAFFTSIRSQNNLPRAHQLAERLDLDLSRRVACMSTGMRQKLALAVTMAAEVPLLVLDEPTSNLDPSVRSEVLSMVREAQNEGRTVIFSSHVLSEIEEVCDRVVILRQGNLVHTQTISHLRRQHVLRAQLTAPLPPVPKDLQDSLTIRSQENGNLVIDAPGELAPLLSWLATLPLKELQIEPVGLRTVYDRYHSGNGQIRTSS